MPELFIGLMSGTSLDGVDGVLTEFDASQDCGLRVLAHTHIGFTPVLTTELLGLNLPGANELHRAALAGNAVARVYADVVAELLRRGDARRSSVVAIGAHGQTVRHRPGAFDGTGYTIQLNSPALLAELCGIDVVADLRSRDVAAGGQGAPLVSAFHQAAFGAEHTTVAVLNIGGISNLTVLRDGAPALGFDCGPGNALMDHWCRLHTGRNFDDGGAWAASGRPIEALLDRMLADPFFAAAPPKSTGRDLFNAGWLEALLPPSSARVRPQDVQATLTELTATACAADVRRHAEQARELLVCGGGVYNQHLQDRLAQRLPGIHIVPTDRRGLPADQVEACAFAWLARAWVRREFGNLPSVTGASGFRLLGALYPAGRPSAP